MTTTEDSLARTARALDHAANRARDLEARVLFRVHHSMVVTLLTILTDPAFAPDAADDWDRICRTLIREAAEAGLVDMAPHYESERRARVFMAEARESDRPRR